IYGFGSSSKNWIEKWWDDLAGNHPIRCVTDQVFCPTSVYDIAKGIEALIIQNKTGAYHIANPEKYTMHRLGLEICRLLGVDEKMVIPIKYGDLILKEKRPPDISLDSSKFIAETNYRFRKVRREYGKYKTL
ncbi:MAG: sugar nucleotide-binding protein, partial [bacterium]|nr:sugar nucleotide-binding protein [bacterium]